MVEPVEPRLLLTATAHRPALPAPTPPRVKLTPIIAVRRSAPQSSPDYTGSTSPGGLSPTIIRSAYGLGPYGSSTITFGSAGVQADGTGQTIAIIDAYDDPTAATDLNAFSTYFGLPTLTNNTTGLSAINSASGPTFTKMSETGSLTSLPTTDPDGPTSTTGYDDWEEEESLDIEWAHVMAPRANIVLIECNSAYNSDLFSGGAVTAASLPGVVAASMSFSGPEYSSDTSYDGDFVAPSGHLGGSATAGGTELAGGVTFLASAGDDGAYAGNTRTITPQYPDTSPAVVSVGGTTLSTSGNAYGGETAWGNGTNSGYYGGGGGGISTVEAQPSYQSATVSAFSTTKRTYPDVSLDADPNSGVPIYDAYDDGGPTTPWMNDVGGTSLASPMMAGLVAVADQDRAVNGLGSLDGRAGTLPTIYSMAAGDYHDVTSGNNGYAAGTGYDLATGRGSPIANLFVPALANVQQNTATVAGRVFTDTNADGVYNGTDTPLAGVQVYLDENNDGVQQPTEPTTTTDANGLFSFASVPAGLTGAVRLVATPAGYVAADTASFTTAANTTATVALGLFPTAYADATGHDAWTVQVSPTSSTTMQILVNGTVAYTAPTSLASSLSFTFTGVGDSLAVDAGNGNPVPTGGVSVNGTSAADGDTLSVLGSAGADTASFGSTSASIDGRGITFANMPNLSVDLRGGTDSLSIYAGTVTMLAPAGTTAITARTFSNLTIAAGATLAVAPPATHATRAVLVATTAAALSVASTGRLDLGGNDLVVHGGSLSQVSALAATGFAGGTWGGYGLASSAAAADATHRTALGVANPLAAGTFDGVAVGTADVLVKYTYYGDTNLDGVVNAADFTRLDAGYVSRLTGWANGDFNYDGTVDGTDYALADNAFNTQSTPL